MSEKEDLERAEIDKVLSDGEAQVKRFSEEQRRVYLAQLRNAKEFNLNAMREDMRIATAIGDEPWQSRVRDVAKKEWKAIQAIDAELGKIK